jgi:hypothetical protein
MGVVYTLSNPKTKQVIYVGYTKQNISVRYGCHMTCAVNGSSPLYVYIRHMIKNGIIPEMKIVVSNCKSSEELFKIQTLGKKHPLLNAYCVRNYKLSKSFWADFLATNKTAKWKCNYLKKEHMTWLRQYNKNLAAYHEKHHKQKQNRELKKLTDKKPTK